ncbi:MAG: DNA gyrase C-terminal beta-propeller domain-containing protein, partial [Burkholderiaceae bacterium]
LKRGELPEVVLNNLYKNTQLQDTFGMNMVALVDGQPRTLNLKQMLEAFLAHRREVVTRRTVFELRKARERGHVLEGLAVAVSNMDEMIALIKASPTPVEAREGLMNRTWKADLVRELLARATETTVAEAFRPDNVTQDTGLVPDGYRLSETQAQEILQMRLQRLTGLEQDKIVGEYKEIIEKIADLLDILAKPARITAIINEELESVSKEFSDKRRSTIELNAEELQTEDLITPQEMVVTLTHGGYIKSQPLSEYQAQRRGGRGKTATATMEDDWIDQLFIANTHDMILAFSNRGRVYWLKVWEVPQGSRASRGKPLVNVWPLEDNEKINVVLPVKAFDDDHFVFMATSMGTVKKTPLSAFSRPMKRGIIACSLDEGDVLIGAALTDGQHDIMLFSSAGKAVRFAESDVRPMGREARGVRGMNLESGQELISMIATADDQAYVLTATENGYGKRTLVSEHTRHGRGTKGMIAIADSERNGRVVSACLVHETDEIMLITDRAVVVRTRVSEVRALGRATQGVTLISVDEGSKLVGVQRIAEADGVGDAELSDESLSDEETALDPDQQ